MGVVVVVVEGRMETGVWVTRDLDLFRNHSSAGASPGWESNSVCVDDDDETDERGALRSRSGIDAARL
ncbi:unnamed protein product [Lampetra fluviatilis]